MTLLGSNIIIRGPGVQLEQLIQLRHAAKNIHPGEINSSKSTIGGRHLSAFRGRGMDFEEVRIYQAGDDIRSIDWRVTARTAKTHTKIFREEKERPVFLVVDQSSSMFFGSKVTYKSVMAAQLAALLAWATLRYQDRIGGIVFNSHQHAEIKPKRSKHALLGVLKQMVDFNQQLFDENRKPPTFSLHKVFEKLRHLAKPGSTLYIISDFAGYDAEAERLLYLLKRHTKVYAILIADSMEERLPAHPQLSLTDGIHKVLLNTGDKKLAEAYQQSFLEKQKFLETSFNKIGIQHYQIWTHNDPARSLQAMLNGKNHSTSKPIDNPIHAV